MAQKVTERKRIHPIPQCSTLRNWFRPRNPFPPIPSISGISSLQFLGISDTLSGRNSGNQMELVPFTELIPQCSTSWNRMTAREVQKISVFKGVIKMAQTSKQFDVYRVD
jgi:hypothetical protein